MFSAENKATHEQEIAEYHFSEGQQKTEVLAHITKFSYCFKDQRREMRIDFKYLTYTSICTSDMWWGIIVTHFRHHNWSETCLMNPTQILSIRMSCILTILFRVLFILNECWNPISRIYTHAPFCWLIIKEVDRGYGLSGCILLDLHVNSFAKTCALHTQSIME